MSFSVVEIHLLRFVKPHSVVLMFLRTVRILNAAIYEAVALRLRVHECDEQQPLFSIEGFEAGCWFKERDKSRFRSATCSAQ